MVYFDEMTEGRRRNPRKDLASMIANGMIEGQTLRRLEAMSFDINAAIAGLDTTSNTTAGGLWALAENQEQFRKRKADPSLIPADVLLSVHQPRRGGL